jgi:actin-related protein 8
MTDNPHTNTFLKNLSQKKYAWMEEAIASNAPAASASPEKSTNPDSRGHKTATSSVSPSNNSNSNRKNKKRSSPEPEITLSPKKHMQTNKTKQKSASPAMSTPPTEVDVLDIEKPKEPRIRAHEPRLPQPHFKYTTFPVKGYNILPTRNITSNYARNDTSYFPGHKAGAEEIAPDVSIVISLTIVLVFKVII